MVRLITPLGNPPPAAAKEWPQWALSAAKHATAQDRGLGDTIARVVGPPRSEAFKRFHEAIFGLWAEPCGCDGKIGEWNAMFPYPEAPANRRLNGH